MCTGTHKEGEELIPHQITERRLVILHCFHCHTVKVITQYFLTLIVLLLSIVREGLGEQTGGSTSIKDVSLGVYTMTSVFIPLLIKGRKPLTH